MTHSTNNPLAASVGASPFRYPGGKAFLSNYLASEVVRMNVTKPEYAEAYAGGAGAAIKLLAQNTVSKIRINDADFRIFCAWKAILDENERFLDRLSNCAIDIDEWNQHAEIVKTPSKAKSPFELGFSTFFLNRTNRSGIILGAGPIGGYGQKGDWRLDARFYRQTLLTRINWLGKQGSKIKISNLDGLTFLRKSAKRKFAEKTLFFVDPPYVGAGSRLYLNLMTDRKHRVLGEFLQSGQLKHWIVTYDDCPLINEVFKDSECQNLAVLYSLQRKRVQNELLIRPHN